MKLKGGGCLGLVSLRYNDIVELCNNCGIEFNRDKLICKNCDSGRYRYCCLNKTSIPIDKNSVASGGVLKVG